MPRLIITEGAARELENCRQFLFEKNPNAAQKAAQTIGHHFSILETNPEIGRPMDDILKLRELIIPFGDSGYVALYLLDDNTVYILAFRHQNEVGY
ncbi:type II toxin-antitoxin system RelE/ParE family toxin [Desulfatiferula olefinivorans]